MGCAIVFIERASRECCGEAMNDVAAAPDVQRCPWAIAFGASARPTESLLPLAVIPSLKLTDRGLVDVVTFEFTSLWV
jgi:adenine deaminase